MKSLDRWLTLQTTVWRHCLCDDMQVDPGTRFTQSVDQIHQPTAPNLGDMVAAVWWWRIGKRSTIYLLASDRSQPLLRAQLGVIVDGHKKGKTVVRKFASAHDLWRSFGQRLVAKGIFPNDLRELMRHEDISTAMKSYRNSMLTTRCRNGQHCPGIAPEFQCNFQLASASCRRCSISLFGGFPKWRLYSLLK